MASKRRPPAERGATVADLHAALDALAPFSLAAEWDNVGLLAGDGAWPVRDVLLAIDLTDAVAAEALRKRASALVVYHPPIFKGIRSITAGAEGPTRRLADLLAARVSILAVHTALDAAAGGTNDVLLDCFEPSQRWPLEDAAGDGQRFKLVTFTPADDIERLRAALALAGAGQIGHYSECSYESTGFGTFRGDETTRPAVGRKQVLERVAETRIEMVVPAARLGAVVRALCAAHRYEEPAFDVYPLRTIEGRGRVGMGRVGQLAEPQTGGALLRRLQRIADLRQASVVGDLRRPFASVTAAAGSFGVRSFRDPRSLVITGEMKHHDALDLLRRGITAIVMGHFASERPVLARLAEQLRRRAPAARFAIARSDRTPFDTLGVE